MEIPRIISADDHVIEPPHLWQTYLPEKFREAGPKVVRKRGHLIFTARTWTLEEDENGQWADCWLYEDKLLPIDSGLAAMSFTVEERKRHAILYDEMLPACYDRTARVASLDINHTEAQMCFPTISRFCGQTWMEGKDRDLGLACVRAYNDWMIDEWCADEARGRLIPLTIIPLWDGELAAQEIRRCADKGSYSFCFSESPYELGLPSVYSEAWNPLWQACEDTGAVINMHIGSSSQFRNTSPDAPNLVKLGLTYEGGSRAMVDWLASGILEQYPSLKIVLSEAQAGWMPFLLERLDNAWDHARAYSGPGGGPSNLTQPPSSFVPGRVYTVIFDDFSGLANRDLIGMGQMMFETDFPHGDSTWPTSKDTVANLATKAGLNETEIRQFVRQNAIECYGLERFGISA